MEAQGRAGIPGAAQAAGRLRPVVAHLSGVFGLALRGNPGELAADGLWRLKPGVASSRVLEDFTGFASDPGLPLLLRQLFRQDPSVRATRDGERLRVDIGGGELTVLATASSGKLLAATEPGAGSA